VNGSFYEHSPDGVDERQAPRGGLFSHDSHHLLDPLWLAAFVWPPGVHLGRFGPTGACGRRLDTDALQERGQFCAWAGWRQMLLAGLWVKLTVYINSPLVAVLRDDARHDLFKRVASLDAAGCKVIAVANNHGSGFASFISSVSSAYMRLPSPLQQNPLTIVEIFVAELNTPGGA
jgi:hypothetical protein